VGIKEFELILETGNKAFPPRLHWQPIFYPVLNQPYAEQIAKEWNTADEFSGFCGIVTAFDVKESYYSQYDVQNVGGDIHNELWVPAEELARFNENIVGEIKAVKAFFGGQFSMPENKLVADALQKLK
jgi:hypothetical protein